MRKPLSLLLAFSVLIQTNMVFAQKQDPSMKVALQTLEQTEADVARAIVESTSLLHRLEKAVKMTEVYKKAVEVPSLVYVGSSGVTLGGLVFIGIGGLGKGVASTLDGVGESLTEVEHRVASVQQAFVNSGNSSMGAVEPIKASAGKIQAFGQAWLDLSKIIVNNPVSAKSGEILLFVLKKVNWVLRKTFDTAWKGINHSYNGLEAASNFLAHRVLSFGETTAESSAGSAAVTSLLASAGYLSYTAWNRGKNIYEKNVHMSDEEIQAIVLNDPEISKSFDKLSNDIALFFSLTPTQKAELKEVIANDMITQKLLTFRAKMKASDDLLDQLEDYEDELRDDYNLSEIEIQEKLAIYEQKLLVADNKLKKNEEKELQDFDILKSAAKVLDPYQLATLSALNSIFKNGALVDAIENQFVHDSKNTVLQDIDNQIKTLEIIKAYIAQAQDFEDVFEKDAVDAVDQLVKKLDSMIELRKKQLELLQQAN